MLEAATVDRILRMHGTGLPVLSLYVRHDPDDRRAFPSRVDAQLHEVRLLAEDPGLHRDARLSLRGDIDRIAESATEEHLHPQAVAFFSCSGRDEFESVELPRPLRDRHVIDETAWVRPLVAILDEYHRCRVVVIDRGYARFFELYQDEMVERDTPVRARTLRKPDYAAGMREHTTHNKAELLAKRHYRTVAEILAEEARRHEYDVLAVGGHEHEISEFLEHLPNDVRDRVAGTFSVHPREDDIGAIHKGAEEVVQRYERAEEERLVADTLDRAAAGGLAVVGVPDCLWAGATAAARHLLLQDGVELAGVVCDADGYLALEGDTCPICSRELRRTPDVLDELVQAVIDEDGAVEHVAAETPLREHVTAALLRFPLPPRPAAGPQESPS
jgi:peptide chain release factor subunit 1